MRESLSRNHLAMIWLRRSGSTRPCGQHFPNRASSVSTTISGKRRSLIFFSFVLPILSWSRFGIAISSRVQITMAEELGMEGRGKFYDDTGAIRDVIENHMLQVVAF